MLGKVHPVLDALRCRVAVGAALLACWSLSSPIGAQEPVTAVPEFIEFTEADAATPAAAALASAQEAFRVSRSDASEDALALAKEVVALASDAYGESHDNVAAALTNLAIMQGENKDFTAAVDNFKSAIEVRERASGTIVSGSLVNPLLGLAGAYMALGDSDEAIRTFERAIHITHVNEGPENLDQIPIVDALSRAHFFDGDFEKANELQDAVFRLRSRRADDDFEQYLDALHDRADWYARLRMFNDAIRFYRRIVRAMSEQYGDDDPRLIQPLMAIADASAMYNDPNSAWGGYAAGSRSLNRAISIARANTDDDSGARLAATLAGQGDWFTARYKARAARPPYQEAWEILDADPRLHGIRDTLFSVPALILRSRLRPVYGVREGAQVLRPERYTGRGYVDAQFDVDALGRPRNVRIVDAEPAGIMDSHVRFQIRQFRYRPAFEAGRPRTYENVTFRHVFRYDPSALTDRDKKRIATTRYEDEVPSAD